MGLTKHVICVRDAYNEQEGYTALMATAPMGHYDAVELLLGNGANMEAVNEGLCCAVCVDAFGGSA